jgi:hypothetical protein
MARIGYKDCVEKAFEPLLRASGRPDLSARLQVIPPNEEERAAQFKKFGSMRPGEAPLFLPNGGFFFSFKIEDTQCFAFSSFLDEADLIESLRGWLQSNDAVLEPIDQATFLFLSYHTTKYYALRPEYQNRRVSLEIIGLAEQSGYEGHDVDDLIAYYRPAYVVSVPSDSIFYDIDIYVVATEMLASVSNLRSPIVDDEFALLIHGLLSLPSIKPENLFLCLTSTRWRYAYLELFRLIESTLYVPWILDLIGDISSTMRAPLLYTALRKNIDWREVKGRSIERVFQDVRDDGELSSLEARIQAFKDVLSSKEPTRAAIGRRVYKIRNQLVHPEDYVDASLLDVSEGQFRDLSVYLCHVVRGIYANYDTQMRD